MTPLPKRKWSTRRTGFNKVARAAETKFASLVICDACGKKKLPHLACKYCGAAVRRVKRTIKVDDQETKVKQEVNSEKPAKKTTKLSVKAKKVTQ